MCVYVNLAAGKSQEAAKPEPTPAASTEEAYTKMKFNFSIASINATLYNGDSNLVSIIMVILWCYAKRLLSPFCILEHVYIGETFSFDAKRTLTLLVQLFMNM